MTSHSILKNSVYNLFGWILPLVVSFLTVPYIVRMLGDDGYGVLMLVIAVIGYFSLLDINLTAGSIRYVAEYHAKGDKNSVNEVLSLSLLSYTVIGIIGASLIYFSTDLFLMDWLKIPQDLKGVTRIIFHLAAIGFFLNIIQSYLSSIPKAIHRFDIAAKIEAGFGISLMVLTVALLYMGFSLLGVVILRLIIAFLNCMTLFVVVKKMIPYSRFISSISRAVIHKMASFSGYSFLSKIAGTITGNTDRLIIGTLISSAAVTLYTIPFLLASRLMNISVRLSMVLFPVASELGALGKREDLKEIYISMSRHIFFLNIVITTILCLFSEQILQIWMGNDFAQKTHIILVLIALGIFIDTLTNLPSLVNDGLSFPQVTGGFAFARALFGFLALLIGAIYYGLLGVAAAYTASSLIFGILFLLYVHKKTIKISFWILVKEAYLKSLIFSLFIVSGTLLFRTFLPTSKIAVMAELIFIVALFGVFAYKNVLNGEWKEKINRYFILAKQYK